MNTTQVLDYDGQYLPWPRDSCDLPEDPLGGLLLPHHQPGHLTLSNSLGGDIELGPGKCDPLLHIDC